MKRLVRAYLQGGLGNQCSICAPARALSLRAGASMTLNLDYLAEDYVYKRKLSLDQFDCAFEVQKPNIKLLRVLKFLRYKLLRDRVSRVRNLCVDKRPFMFGPLPAEWRGTLTLDGYWQSEKYFYDARGQLLKDFQLKDDVWTWDDSVAQQIRAEENAVFLHVRSYKEVPGNDGRSSALALMPYYRRAIAYVRELVKSPKFFVFSDDIALAKELLFAEGGDAFVFVGAGNETKVSGQIRDFTLMRMCKHGIVADSSFSWWAGWLGEQEWLSKGASPLRLHVDREVMNRDFWPDRWIAIGG